MSATVKLIFGSSEQTASSRDVVLMEMIEYLLCEPILEILPERSNLLVWTDVARTNGDIALHIVVEGQEADTYFVHEQIDSLLVSLSV